MVAEMFFLVTLTNPHGERYKSLMYPTPDLTSKVHTFNPVYMLCSFVQLYASDARL